MNEPTGSRKMTPRRHEPARRSRSPHRQNTRHGNAHLLTRWRSALAALLHLTAWPGHLAARLGRAAARRLPSTALEPLKLVAVELIGHVISGLPLLPRFLRRTTLMVMAHGIGSRRRLRLRVVVALS